MSFSILYIFNGEKAQGAEIVIKRLIDYNIDTVNAHLFISPGKFANNLISENKPYEITTSTYLKKLNRGTAPNLKYYFAAIKNHIFLSVKVYRYIKKNNIQVVHANTIVPASYLIPLILYTKVFSKSFKFIWSDHDILNYSTIDYLLSKVCVKLYDCTLVVSKAVKQKYIQDKKVKVLYNGLDTKIFKADFSKRNKFRMHLQLPIDLIAIGMPAVVTPRKGQLELIKVFNSLCKKVSNIFLVLAGGYEEATPEYSNQVKAAISTNEKVIHVGYIDDMVEFYNGCDIIVSNSNLLGSEPLGTTLYEAMACEKIVVASNTGGTKEIISDNVDGFLFEPENEESLKLKLEYVIDNFTALTTVRTAAVNKPKTKFNITNMKQNYNEIVKNI